MKLRSIALLAAPLLFSACFTNTKEPNRQENAEVSTDTLTYQYKVVKRRDSDCGNRPDSACTVPVLKYPVFDKQQALNDTISYRLANLFAGAKDAKAATPQQAADNLIKEYETDKKQGNAASAQMHYELDSHADVIRQDSMLVTLELDGYQFAGSAHGLGVTYFINWDMKKHRNLTMDDVFVDGYLPKLNQVADTIFRKEENLEPNASLANDYFFKDAKFSVNRNFLITPLGIRFLYNPYEIKPYAAGQTSIDIPYVKISKLLRPSTPAAIYSK